MPPLAWYRGLCHRLAQGRPPPGPLPPPARSLRGAPAPTRAPRLPSGPSAGEARPRGPRAAPPQAEAMRWGPPPPPTTDLPRPVPASLGCWRRLPGAEAEAEAGAGPAAPGRGAPLRAGGRRGCAECRKRKRRLPGNGRRPEVGPGRHRLCRDSVTICRKGRDLSQAAPGRWFPLG